MDNTIMCVSTNMPHFLTTCENDADAEHADNRLFVNCYTCCTLNVTGLHVLSGPSML